jgi:2-oxo-4-hydroxy-4-carboxy-5-ureidoimidazoline decarboxylase
LRTMRPFENISSIYDAIYTKIRMLSHQQLVTLICSLPKIQELTIGQGLSGHTIGEHSPLASLSQTQRVELADLNSQYFDKFGFNFVLALRRHTNASILRTLRSRLKSDSPAEELQRNVLELLLVVRLRLVESISGPGAPKVHGSITSHVLDTTIGLPAVGVKLELYELGTSEPMLLASSKTNSGGRTPASLIANQPLRIGTYELRFYVAEYFDSRVPATTQGLPFLDIIPIRFIISEPESHYHIPLLVTPYSYSTYRGS